MTAVLTSAHEDLIAAHEHLVPITVRRRFMSLLSPRYSFEDACQEGWVGLRSAAVAYDPDVCAFETFAIFRIRSAVRAGAGRAEGLEFRRRRAQPVLSLDALGPDGDGLADTIADPGPGPDTAALDRAGLAAAVDAARASVDDLIDLTVLDWLLNLDDTRTQADLAAELDIHPQRIWRRRNRLAAQMRRAFNAPEV